MLKQESLEATVVVPLTIPAAAFEPDEAPYHSDDGLSELALLKYELGELRREVREARDRLDAGLRLTRRAERARVAARSRRRRQTNGAMLARAVLRLMVAVFTLGGAISGGGVGMAVVRLWGDSWFALVAAGVFGLGVALAAWLLAALAAIVLETADAVRDLPA